MSVKKESGEITSDREEILKIYANFYKSLYIQKVPTLENTMKSSPDTEEIPKFTEEELERAIKGWKDTKPKEWMEKIFLCFWTHCLELTTTVP